MVSETKKRLTVRDAVPADAAFIREAVAALARETVFEDKCVMTVDDVRRYGFGPEKSFECLVAFADDTPVGTVVFYDEFSTWRSQKGLYILDIFVSSDARGLGAGRKLIEAVAAKASQRGAVYIRLTVDQENTAAIGFYQAYGFREGAHDRTFLLDNLAAAPSFKEKE